MFYSRSLLNKSCVCVKKRIARSSALVSACLRHTGPQLHSTTIKTSNTPAADWLIDASAARRRHREATPIAGDRHAPDQWRLRAPVGWAASQLQLRVYVVSWPYLASCRLNGQRLDILHCCLVMSSTKICRRLIPHSIPVSNYTSHTFHSREIISMAYLS